MNAGIFQAIKARAVRCQFSLRTIFLLTVAAAALSALYRVAPQLDVLAVGTAPAIVCCHRVIKPAGRRRLSLPLIAAMLPSLGMLYVVSIGPAILLDLRFSWVRSIFKRFYAPLLWLYMNTSLRDVLDWYLGFWYTLMV